MYGHRGSLFGSGGVSDGYEIGSKRPRFTEQNPYFAVSSSSGGYHHQQFPYATTDTRNYQQPPPTTFPVVRLRGLPFNCSDDDIYKFFTGLDIIDIFLVNKDGRFSGEAFVVFAGHFLAELALHRDRQNIGRRYVEVFRCKKQEYYSAIAAGVSEGGYGGGSGDRHSSPPARRKRSPDKDSMEYTEVLKMRGLPYSARKSDIVKFFGEFDVKEEMVQIPCRPDGKSSGEAFVEFGSVEEARKAMCKDKMMIGSRYVELFPSTRDEAGQAASRSRQ